MKTLFSNRNQTLISIYSLPNLVSHHIQNISHRFSSKNSSLSLFTLKHSSRKSRWLPKQRKSQQRRNRRRRRNPPSPRKLLRRRSQRPGRSSPRKVEPAPETRRRREWRRAWRLTRSTSSKSWSKSTLTSGSPARPWESWTASSTISSRS